MISKNTKGNDERTKGKVKERGIIMSGDNPKLILEGRKTQTRRIVKRHFQGSHYTTVDPVTWHNPTFSSALGEVMFHYAAGGTSHSSGPGPLCIPCPYGVAGDRLWVRETWAHERQFDHLPPSQIPQSAHVISRIKYGHEITRGWHKARSSIHMPRWASRITLEITKVRVERLQDISQHDCEAEGMRGGCRVRQLYRAQWDNLYGKGAWDENPWVWVIEFRLSPDFQKHQG